MMSKMPCSLQILRKFLKKDGGGVRNPPSPMMGSMMMAAVSCGVICAAVTMPLCMLYIALKAWHKQPATSRDHKQKAVRSTCCFRSHCSPS